MRTSFRAVALAAAGSMVLLGACAPTDGNKAEDSNTLRIATIANADMQRLQDLSEEFLAAHPGVTIKWDVLSENNLRQRVSTDVSTGGGQIDVATVGTYETRIWAEREWLVPLEGMPAGFDIDGVIPSVRDSLSYEGTAYAAPFYGEASMTMYRTDILSDLGIEMPQRPTWDFIVESAAAVDAAGDVSGICVRGLPGWGENTAFVGSIANSYGARWFDMDWTPQFGSPEWAKAIATYAALGEFAPDGVQDQGYAATLELFQNGECAIWVDSTIAGSAVLDPSMSSVAENVGFAVAPTGDGSERTNWLWAWALAVPASSDKQELAKEFVAWASSDEYEQLVADRYGWLHAPAGVREDLYSNSDYLDVAPFAPLVHAALTAADPWHPVDQEVPYVGIHLVSIPGFQSIGTAVGGRFSLALAGELSVEQALEDSQWVTEAILNRAPGDR